MQIKEKSRKPSPYKIIPGKNGTGSITLYLEDCIQGMEELLPANSIGAVVTSPPYNIGVHYSSHRDNLPRQKYLDWMGELGVAVKRVLRDDGSFFLNIGDTPKDQWIAWDVAQVLRKDFVLQNVIHWVKSIAIAKGDVGDYPGITGDVAVGHYKPIVSNRFLSDCHEYIFHFTKSGEVKLQKLRIGVPYQDKSNIGRWASKKGSKGSWQYLVHPLRDDQEQDGAAPPGDFSHETSGDVPQAPWSLQRSRGVEIPSSV